MTSLSLRERGLKSHDDAMTLTLTLVALLARAWIEMPLYAVQRVMNLVALLARAWIEIFPDMVEDLDDKVALLARAWIEIIVERCYDNIKEVALLARAWIEIPSVTKVFVSNQRRSPCESVD